ncbi:MCE family protein [Saccharopolyspora sp. HNM0986]|uniref:MlaD family protein n=1 Tax=Saccharopolyspora galaxeae TaxID=2781241 RepID=UPI00190E0ED3|nr:MlaD family protein [Saccharopolyspora sp. HNM0986]MBK0870396.1 MCE family protein [Saccharopolyspora sp. HNM0986]
MRFFKHAGIRIGLVLAAVATVVATGVAVTRFDEDKDVPLTVMFANASPMIPGNLVRLDGVEVGQIESIELRNGQAAVKMRIDRSVLPLHSDASAKIRPVTLLGERFIDLNRGSPGAPELPEPMEIRADRATRAVDLDEVLNSLDDPSSTALAALVTTLGEGTAGQGANIDEALKALAPALQDTQRLGSVLEQQNEVLGQLVDRTSPVAKALAEQNGGNLDKAVESGKQLLASVAAQRQATKDSLAQLPGTLEKARNVLSEVSGVAEQATPALRDVRPVTDNLTEITDELDKFADAADPALASLPPVLDKGKALLDQAAPAVRELKPGVEQLPGVSSSAHRLVGDLTPAMGTALDFIKYWAMSTNGRDGLGNYFRAFVVTTPQSLLQYPGVGVGPPGQPGPRPAPELPIPGVPGVPPPLPGLPSIPGLTGSPEDGGLKPDAPAPGGPAANGDGSATGLELSQETALVDQLLGGR